MINKVVIANVFGSLNRGDAALVEVCVDEIKEAFPEVLLSGIAFRPEIQRNHLPAICWFERIGNCRSRLRILKRLCNVIRQLAVFVFISTGRLAFLSWLIPKDQRAAIQEIASSDLVVSCAGGYLEDSNPSYYSNLVQLWVAISFGKLLILAPQSIGPIRSKLGRRFAKAILGRANMICVRETESYNFALNQLELSPQKVIRTGDLAFWHAERIADGVRAPGCDLGIRPGEAYVAASVLDWAFPLSKDPVESRSRYVAKLALVLRSVHQALGHRIILVNQVTTDIETARAVASQCGEFVIVDDIERSVGEIRDLIGGSQVFLGSRFHSCIFAILASVPVVALSYLPKTTGIMRDLGLSERVFDIDRFNEADIVDALTADYRARLNIAAQLRATVDNYKGSFPRFSRLLQSLE